MTVKLLIESDRGQARIQSQAKGLKYVPLSGDPLELDPLDHGFKAEALKSDSEWFTESAGNKYPDAQAAREPLLEFDNEAFQPGPLY